MSTFMAEALMNSLIAFARAGGEGPREITLSLRDYPWLASDLGANDPTAPLRLVYRHDTPPEFAGPVGTTQPTRYEEIRIGKSFVFNGPLGPVTIKEAT